MIRLDRSRSSAPAQLSKDGEERLREHRKKTGALRSDDFDKKVFASEEVKAALYEMQHEKCCYCEKSCESWHEDVEHFRPKAEAIRAEGNVEEGYWWLAYSFENLLFACKQCNRTKGSHFPLKKGARALKPEEHPRITPESALVLDPGVDIPESHLTFVEIPKKGYQVAPRNRSAQGKKTIDILGLDRDGLSKMRWKYHRKHLSPLIKRFQSSCKDSDQRAMKACREEALMLVEPDAPFSLFSRVILRDAGLL